MYLGNGGFKVKLRYIKVLYAFVFICAIICVFLYGRQYERRFVSLGKELQRSLRKESQYEKEGSSIFVQESWNCDPIHICVVCVGLNSSREVVPMLKSVLFYRKRPLHFHFLTDRIAETILGTLFKTWRLQQVNISFYSSHEALGTVAWIPGQHYSGPYGHLKLTLPEVLPSWLSRVILLDTDVTLAANIGELWTLFDRMNNDQAMALIENQSDWYLGTLWKKHKPWPAIGRGFNTGVALLRLSEMRRMNWSAIWEPVARHYVNLLGGTSLADQDIINAVLVARPDMVARLPCEWNVQLSDHSTSESCLGNATDFKIIHWNSPRKIQVKIKHANYFRNLYLTFLNYDGNLLRHQFIECDIGAIEEVQVDPNDECYEFRKAGLNTWRTHLFYLDYQYEPVDAADVTLAVQMSMDRIQFLEELCNHWNGPVSLAIYLTDTEVQQFVNYVQSSETLSKRKNIAYHVVYKEGEFYPVNFLRNICLENIDTEFIFLTDIDFLPMFSLYEYLRKYTVQVNEGNSKTAFVVPAFESQRYRISFPHNKKELLSMWDQGVVFTFRYHIWATGHAGTNYDKWRNSMSPYRVQWQPDFEPYVVVKRNIVPYDTRFVGFGWNKVSHIMELEAQGYKFVVLPSAFMIHMPHAPSLDIVKFRKSPQYRICLKLLKNEFVEYINKKYVKRWNQDISSK